MKGMFTELNIDYKLREKINLLFLDGKDHSRELTVYTYLLFNANYKDSDKVSRGQILTSYRALSNATHYSENEIRTIIGKLTERGLISKRSCRQYTVFTLLHYDSAAKRKKESEKAEKESEKKEKEQKEIDKAYFEHLRLEIRKRELTDEERKFFNSYYDLYA